jgi:transposase-like protein
MMAQLPTPYAGVTLPGVVTTASAGIMAIFSPLMALLKGPARVPRPGRGSFAIASLVVFQKWRWTENTVTLGLIFIVSLRKEWPMTFIAVRCPHCQSDQIVKRGKTARGTQRSLCQNTLCTKGSFLLDSCNCGCLPEVKHTIIDMSLNASGVRDTARSLHICPNPGLRELKKKEAALESVNTALLRTLHPAEVAWDVERAGDAEAEMDEMWSCVRHTGNPRWLWHAIDHHTGKVLAYVFGRRQEIRQSYYDSRESLSLMGA